MRLGGIRRFKRSRGCHDKIGCCMQEKIGRGRRKEGRKKNKIWGENLTDVCELCFKLSEPKKY